MQTEYIQSRVWHIKRLWREGGHPGPIARPPPLPTPVLSDKEVGIVGVGKYDPAAVFAGYRLAAVAVADTGREPPESAEPVEIGVTVLDGGVVGSTRTWLVRPTRAITTWATRGHGIRDRDVAQAPVVGEVADQIREAIGERVVVAHRGLHCHDLLAAVLPGWAPPRVLDVRRVSVLAWPAVSQALGSLAAQARLTVPGSLGRAGHDAPATAMLFLAAAKKVNTTVPRLFASATVLESQPR